MSQEPTRIANLNGVPELTETLKAAERVLPDDATVLRLSARLGVAPNASAGSPSGLAKGAGHALGAKIGAIVFASGAGLIAWAFLRAAPSDAPAAREPIPILPVPASSPPPVRVPEPLPSNPPEASPIAALPAPRSSASARNPSELELVAAAERLLHSNPGAALKATEQHARLFPTGALSEEREVIAIEALSRLGNVKTAQGRAEAFLRMHPASAHARRVERAVRRGFLGADAGGVKKE